MWTCTKCRRGNQDNVSVCSCGAEHMWTCTTCETLNSFSSAFCSICHTKSPVAGSGTADGTMAQHVQIQIPGAYGVQSQTQLNQQQSVSDELSPESALALRKRKNLRKALLIANCALLAVNIIGIILLMR